MAVFPKVRDIKETKIFKRMFELYQSDGGDKTFTEFKQFYEYSVTMLDAMLFDNLEMRVIKELEQDNVVNCEKKNEFKIWYINYTKDKIFNKSCSK